MFQHVKENVGTGTILLDILYGVTGIQRAEHYIVVVIVVVVKLTFVIS